MTLISNKDLMTSARQSLQGKWGKGAFAILIYMGFYAISLIVAFAILPRFQINFLIHVYNIGILAITWGFVNGLYWFFLTLSRGQDAKYAQIFSAFRDGRQFIRIIFTYFLQLVFICLWTLLLIIPGIIAFCSYSMTYFIIIDHPEMGPLDALSLSKKMMKGHKAKFFFLTLRFIGWFFLSMITLNIASFWVFPYLITSLAKFYDDVKANGAMLEEVK